MKVVQILGGGYGSISFPVRDNAQVWMMNSVIRARYSFEFDGWTAQFDLHTKAWILAHRPEVYEWYKKNDGKRPIYLSEYDPDVRGCKVFHKIDYVRFFKTKRFAHTLDYLIAKATHEEFEQIELYYCPLDNHNKNTTNYWIGRAEQAGINIVMDNHCGVREPDEIYDK